MTSTPFFARLRERIAEHGGVLNAHLHLDRSGTHDETLRIMRDAVSVNNRSSLSLATKHSLIPSIHASCCYEPALLAERVRTYIDLLVAAGTTRADTLVDVTADRVGLTALEVFLLLKHEYRDVLDLRVGAYSPLGFKDSESQRWEILVEGARLADFIGGLPERDDQADYPDHIGFAESCGRLVTLSQQLGKPLHLHIDQKNLANENGAECAIGVINDLGVRVRSIDGEPSIWFVHMISSSAFEESRFQKLLTSLVEHRLGVICCPSAAISMRQIRSVSAPTHNSIARVLDMLAAGVPVRLGSDNICDITSPAGTTDLLDEVFVLCNAIRFYDEAILAKLAAGVLLNADDRSRIQKHLKNDDLEMLRVVQQYQQRREAA